MDQQEKIPQGPPSDQSDDEADQFVKGGKSRHVINAEGEVEAQEKKENRGDDDEMLFALEQAEGDEFMAVKPWKGAMVAPSDHDQVDNSAPEQEYFLQYVYGYRCSDSRQNVRYNAEGKVVYFTAAVGIILDQATNTQTIFGGKAVKPGMHSGKKYHNDDITCLNISRDRTLVATGQVGSRPTIIVWNCVDCEPVQRIVLPKGSRAVKTIAINNDNTRVACSDDHNDHYVRVYEIESGKLLFEHESGSSKLYDMDFSSTEDNFVIAGHKTIKFYTGNGDGTYSDNKGILGPAMKELTAFSSANYNSEGQAVITNIKGSVLTFKGRQCCNFNQGVHKGAIFAAYMDQGDVLYTGGKDGFVRSSDGKEWDFGHTIRSVDVSGGKIVAGLRNGTITEQTSEDNDSRAVLMQSHYEGEVWGLDKFGDGKTLITSGDDNCIMVWDYEQRKRIGCGTVSEKAGKARKAAKGASTMSDLPPNQQSRAVCHSPVSGHIAVSDNEGGVTIRAGVNSLDEVVATLKPKAKEWIQAMEFSPDGSKLAVGSHDNFIRIYSVESGYDHHCTLKGHNSFITSLDWSADGKYIRSNCGAYELLFFDAESGDHLPDGASMTADVKWASHTVKIAWDTEEIFPPGTDGTHVNAVAISDSGKLFASGDDWGLVCLHRNPIRNPKHKCNSYRAHSEHVVNVVFDKNDEYIFSVGGYDQTLMQWRKVQ